MSETLNIGVNIQTTAYSNIELLDMTQSFTKNNPNPYDPSTGPGYVITPESASSHVQMTSKKFVLNLGHEPNVDISISVGVDSTEGADVIVLQMTGQGGWSARTIYGEAKYLKGTFNIYLLPASEAAAKRLSSFLD